MPITSRNSSIRSVKDIRTHAGKFDRISSTYKAYMRISCLELEKARRLNEREGAMNRVSKINERLRDIEAEKALIQKNMLHFENDTLSHTNDTSKTSARPSTGRGAERESGRSTEGFKIRY